MADPEKAPEVEADEDSEVEFSDEEDEVGDLPEPVGPPPNLIGRRRTSVSAEVFNASETVEQKVVPKSEEAREKIRSKMRENVLFNTLDEKQLSMVVDAADEKSFKGGDVIIQQGDKVADYYYILESGTAEAYKSISDGVPPARVKSYVAGEAFGELALLYNAPRAATVKATSECATWAIDRVTFRHILMKCAMERRQKYETFLTSVPLLKDLSTYERSTIADSLEPTSMKAGETIIKQGEEGDAFYILEEGTVVADVDGKEVASYTSGGCFGELALLNDAPRAATCVVKEDAQVLRLTRRAFKRLMGSLEKILRRNEEHYKEVMSNN